MDKAVLQEFSQRFCQALEEAGFQEMERQALAELFGVTPQAVRKWMNAESMPKSSRAPGIARVLGVRRAWLLDGELPVRAVDISDRHGRYGTGNDESFTLSGEEYTLLCRYRGLPKKLRDSVAVLVQQMSRELGR